MKKVAVIAFERCMGKNEAAIINGDALSVLCSKLGETRLEKEDLLLPTHNPDYSNPEFVRAAAEKAAGSEYTAVVLCPLVLKIRPEVVELIRGKNPNARLLGLYDNVWSSGAWVVRDYYGDPNCYGFVDIK